MVLENIHMRTRIQLSNHACDVGGQHVNKYIWWPIMQLNNYAHMLSNKSNPSEDQLLIYMVRCQMKRTLLFIIQQTKDSYGTPFCVCFWMTMEPKAIFCNKVANICMLCRRPACWILHTQSTRTHIKVRCYHGTTMTCIQSMIGCPEIWLLKDS